MVGGWQLAVGDWQPIQQRGATEVAVGAVRGLQAGAQARLRKGARQGLLARVHHVQ